MARGQKVNVYTGPGYNYIRGANGKAMLSTNGWVDCYGMVGDWYLIEYEISSGRWRRGYINRSDIKGSDRMNGTQIPYADAEATLRARVDMTDDPKLSGNTLMTLRQGQTVTVRFFEDEWACVCAQSAAGLAQGYVPAGALELAAQENVPQENAPQQEPDPRRDGVQQEESPVQVSARALEIGSVQASTYINGRKTKWKPEYMLDGLEETSWQFRTTDVSSVSDVMVEFRLDSPSCVTELWIKNGFWKITDGYDQYWRNGRLSRIEVSFRVAGSNAYTDAVTLTLEDDNSGSDFTRLPLGTHRGVQAVLVRVLDIYVGSKFTEDVAVSEMRIAGAKESDLGQPQALNVQAQAPQKTVITGELIKNQVNLREKPSASSKSLKRFAKGTEFEVLGRTSGGGYDWYKVTNGSVTGYFRSDMFRVSDESAVPEL